jgi:hypothetical protein
VAGRSTRSLDITSAIVQIHHIKLSREQLDRVPADERRLLILLAHAANELNVLVKLFHYAAGSVTDGAPSHFEQAHNTQALVLGRTLTGKIYEWWVLMQAAFFGSKLSQIYEPLFEAEARTALDALKRYFGKDNIIGRIRNKFAFHYSLDQVDAGYAAVIDGDPLDSYISKHNANTLYAFAETVAGRAMLDAINPNDHKAAFGQLIDETSRAVSQIADVTGQIMALCFARHLGGNFYSLGAEVIEVQGAPNSQTVSIPYFIELEGGDA